MKFLTVQEVARILSVDKNVIYRLIVEDGLSAYHICERTIRIDENDLIAWMQQRKIQSV